MLQRVMIILWPSFLVAIVAEGVFFSLFDPGELIFYGSQIDLSPIAAYTLGFFFIWAFCALTSMLTCYLIKTPADRPPP